MDEAKAELIEYSRMDFDTFAMHAFGAVSPGVDYMHNWHVECIAEHLTACFRGEIKRLIINLPPRSLKSYLVSQAFPAWILGQNPAEKFINVSYGAEVAEQNALSCRKIIDCDFFKACFQHFKIGGLDRNMHFQTPEGGQYYATSALSPVTGMGCNYMICDDLLKPMDAYSDAVRASTNENLRTTLMNRFDDKRIGKFIMVMQRVHEDDPTGHLLKDGGYVHLKLPGETKTAIHVQLKTPTRTLKWDMPENSLLFPERLTRGVLDQLRLDMSELSYAGQILQEPVPIGGGEFKDNWIGFYEEGTARPSSMNVCIICDAAGGEELNKKKKKTSDYTAFMVIGLANDNNYYLLDAMRDRLNPTERIDKLFELHRKWNGLCKKSPKVGYEKYGLMTDTHYIKLKQREESYMFPLIELGGKVSKEERIRRLIPDMQNGRWYFPTCLLRIDHEGRQFDLVKELIFNEMAMFPRARHDDMLDALSRVLDEDLHMIFPRLQPKIEKYTMAPGRSAAISWMDA